MLATNYNRGMTYQSDEKHITIFPEYVVGVVNSFTAIRVLAGTKNSRPVRFYSRNSMKSTFNHKQNNPQHYHNGGAVCPSYGMGSMDPPDQTRVTSSEGVGRGGGKSNLTKSINC
jgi:hypothetical protein